MPISSQATPGSYSQPSGSARISSTHALVPCSSRARSRSDSLSRPPSRLVLLLRCGGAARASADGLDLLDVGQDGLVVHLGAGERVVAEDDDVELAGLEGDPLLGALLGVSVSEVMRPLRAPRLICLRLEPMTATR
jgi:hypothetical protein